MMAGALHSLKGMMENLNRFSGMQNVVLAPSFSATSTCQYTLIKSLEAHRNVNSIVDCGKWISIFSHLSL